MGSINISTTVFWEVFTNVRCNCFTHYSPAHRETAFFELIRFFFFFFWFLQTGSRLFGEEGSTKSCVRCEIDFDASVIQIGNIIALWISLFRLEMALHSQIFRNSCRKERNNSQEMVQGKVFVASKSSVCDDQSFLLIHLLLQGNCFF